VTKKYIRKKMIRYLKAGTTIQLTRDTTTKRRKETKKKG
jgi:hypothetical protein